MSPSTRVRGGRQRQEGRKGWRLPTAKGCLECMMSLPNVRSPAAGRAWTLSTSRPIRWFENPPDIGTCHLGRAVSRQRPSGGSGHFQIQGPRQHNYPVSTGLRQRSRDGRWRSRQEEMQHPQSDKKSDDRCADGVVSIPRSPGSALASCRPCGIPRRSFNRFIVLHCLSSSFEASASWVEIVGLTNEREASRQGHCSDQM